MVVWIDLKQIIFTEYSFLFTITVSYRMLNYYIVVFTKTYLISNIGCNLHCGTPR